VVAAICYSSFLLSPLTGGPSGQRGFVSELEAPGTPYAWLYRGSDVAAGLSIVLLAFTLTRWLPRRRQTDLGLLLLALVGLSSILDGATTMRCDPATDAACAHGESSVGGLVSQLSTVHTDTGLIGFFGAAAGAILLGAVSWHQRRLSSTAQLAAGVAIAGCGLLDLVLLLTRRDLGSVERLRILLSSAWFLLLGQVLSGHRAGARRSSG
jgi:hypothetical protein